MGIFKWIDDMLTKREAKKMERDPYLPTAKRIISLFRAICSTYSEFQPLAHPEQSRRESTVVAINGFSSYLYLSYDQSVDSDRNNRFSLLITDTDDFNKVRGEWIHLKCNDETVLLMTLFCNLFYRGLISAYTLEDIRTRIEEMNQHSNNASNLLSGAEGEEV